MVTGTRVNFESETVPKASEKRAEVVVAVPLDEDAAAGAFLAAEDAGTVRLGPVEEGVDDDLRRGDAEDARAGETAAVLAGAAGVGAQGVALDDEGVLRLQDLDRRVAAVAVVRAEDAVAVVVDGAAPAAALDVVVRVVLAVLGVDAAEEEVAGRGPFGRLDAVGHGAGEGAQDDVLDVRVGLGVAADRGAGMLDVDDRAGAA